MTLVKVFANLDAEMTVSTTDAANNLNIASGLLWCILADRGIW